jgi:hypothetical protein
MKTFTLAAIAAVVLVAGIAYGQAALPMQAVEANRVVVRVEEWKDVSFQADSATFEAGEIRLTGNVRISVSGHVMTANSAVIQPTLLTLEGNSKVEPPAAR